jgi:transposase, IS5 family
MPPSIPGKMTLKPRQWASSGSVYPNRSTKSSPCKCEQKKRWFRNGQKRRTGCEGRISVAKRRHGLNRCRYKGDRGMKRRVGIGVIADTLINIGRVMAQAAVEP